eukprot:m.1545197 g.1545197  ORF g.1545197 m.1545197 type:complete len:211 (+) comp25259_c0_seq3:5967-6599(+)
MCWRRRCMHACSSRKSNRPHPLLLSNCAIWTGLVSLRMGTATVLLTAHVGVGVCSIVSIDGASTQHKVLAEVTRQLKAVHDSVDLTVVADVAGMEAQAAQLEAELAGLDQSDLGNTTGPISRSTPLVPVRRIVLDKSHGGKFGFNLQKSTDGGLRVKRILKASLAQSNGLRVNDHVVTLNGHDVSAFTIAQALNIIRAAGNVLHIEVKRS